MTQSEKFNAGNDTTGFTAKMADKPPEKKLSGLCSDERKMLMKINTTFGDGKLHIFLEGELDHHAAKKVMRAIEENIDANLPRDCILDMKRLTFMDSSGIAVILKTHRRMNETGGRMSVENAPKQPMRVIDAAKIDRIVRITTMAKE